MMEPVFPIKWGLSAAPWAVTCAGFLPLPWTRVLRLQNPVFQRLPPAPPASSLILSADSQRAGKVSSHWVSLDRPRCRGLPWRRGATLPRGPRWCFMAEPVSLARKVCSDGAASLRSLADLRPPQPGRLALQSGCSECGLPGWRRRGTQSRGPPDWLVHCLPHHPPYHHTL